MATPQRDVYIRSHSYFVRCPRRCFHRNGIKTDILRREVREGESVMLVVRPLQYVMGLIAWQILVDASMFSLPALSPRTSGAALVVALMLSSLCHKSCDCCLLLRLKRLQTHQVTALLVYAAPDSNHELIFIGVVEIICVYPSVSFSRVEKDQELLTKSA